MDDFKLSAVGFYYDIIRTLCVFSRVGYGNFLCFLSREKDLITSNLVFLFF